MYQTFSFNHIHTTLISTDDDVLMNAARFQARLSKSRALSAPDTDSMARFSLIMAHVVDSVGFPFAIPDPFAHPETVGLAWDAYMTEAPALWDQMLAAIDIPMTVAQEVNGKLQEAIAEMDAVSAHNISPFNRIRYPKRPNRR